MKKKSGHEKRNLEADFFKRNTQYLLCQFIQIIPITDEMNGSVYMADRFSRL
jgi:hypothetical protein